MAGDNEATGCGSPWTTERTLTLRHDDPQLRHLDHAWSTTVHGAQGSTADGVIAVLDSGHGSLTDQSTFYVEISRARDSAVVLTDNREQLVEVLEAHTGERATALEAVGEDIGPEALRRRLAEKGPVWTPREEWTRLEAKGAGGRHGAVPGRGLRGAGRAHAETGALAGPARPRYARDGGRPSRLRPGLPGGRCAGARVPGPSGCP